MSAHDDETVGLAIRRGDVAYLEGLVRVEHRRKLKRQALLSARFADPTYPADAKPGLRDVLAQIDQKLQYLDGLLHAIADARRSAALVPTTTTTTARRA